MTASRGHRHPIAQVASDVPGYGDCVSLRRPANHPAFEEAPMSIPVHITFRHLTARPDLEAEILTQVAHLERFFERIVDCRVLIEQPHRRRDEGNPFRVVIELTVPQDRLVIAHDASLHGRVQDLGEPHMAKSTEAAAAHKYLHEALHDAFRAAGRQLQDYAGQQREAARST
jgi:hypothetical protein